MTDSSSKEEGLITGDNEDDQYTTSHQPGLHLPQQNVPTVVQGNGSISKVHMSRKCNMRYHKFPRPIALVEHMNRNHFNSLDCINMVSKADNDAHKSEYQDRSVHTQFQS